MALDGDLLRKILGNVDTITLANAACVSSEFWSIARQESMWEEACFSLWPSTQNPQVKHIISFSLGGFRKFYANCFPVIAYDEAFQNDSTFSEQDGSLEVNTSVPSDFLWVVDVQYNNKAIFSKVVWGIPFADNFPGWFLESPFRFDIINFEDDESNEDELPTIMSVDEVGKKGKFWRQLMENIKLSWIVINKRTGQAANLSSWSPLAGQRHPTSDDNFLMRFGTLLPAVGILPCKVVECILEMKCRVSDIDHTSLKMIEVSVRMEDMIGDDVNGRNALRILDRALRYRRSSDRNKILELQRKRLTERRNLREVSIRSQDHPKTLWIISAIIAYVSFYYLMSLFEIVAVKN